MAKQEEWQKILEKAEKEQLRLRRKYFFSTPIDFSLALAFSSLAHPARLGKGDDVEPLSKTPTYEDVVSLRDLLILEDEFELGKGLRGWFLRRGTRRELGFVVSIIPEGVSLHTHPYREGHRESDFAVPSFQDILHASKNAPATQAIVGGAGLTVYSGREDLRPFDIDSISPISPIDTSDPMRIFESLHSITTQLYSGINDSMLYARGVEQTFLASFYAPDGKINYTGLLANGFVDRLIPWGQEARSYWEQLV